MKKFLVTIALVIMSGCGGSSSTAPLTPPPDNRLIVVIGDSFAIGNPGTTGRLDAKNLDLQNVPGQVSYTLEQDTKLPTINNGMGSMTVANIVNRWGRDVLKDGSGPEFWPGATPTLPRRASHVWLHVGANDVILHVDEETIKQGFSSLITSARANGIKLYIDTIMLPKEPSIYAQDFLWTIPVINRINDWLFTQQGNGVTIMDFNAFIADPSDTTRANSALLVLDGTHPNAEGYTLWGHEISAQMEKSF